LTCFLPLVAEAESANNIERQTNENKLLGNWYFKDGSGAFEVLELTIENGHHSFSSWLHNRPDSNGSWSLSGQKITFRISSGDTIEWEIISVSSSRLAILETGETQEAIYIREPENE
jgi:hypothetical protein